jgi:antibiotic biosynthesis monooxygenase (ABM) superfamily enzyme
MTGLARHVSAAAGRPTQTLPLRAARRCSIIGQVASEASASSGAAERPSPPAAPPRWKTAVLVWLAIYPSLTVILWLVGPAIRDWPVALRTLLLTIVLVPLMVYVLLPALHRLLGPWARRPSGRR